MEMNNIKEKLGDIPTSLKVVLWLNAILALVTIAQSLAYITTAPLSTNVENGLNVLLSVLIIIGIIQASRLIRIVVLIFSWIAVLMIGIGMILLFADGIFAPQVIWAIIPFAIGIINIWGLCTRRSKIYFGY